MENLQDISIQYIKGVGPARMKLFLNLGIQSVEDLLYFFPRRYEDRQHMASIAEVKIGEQQTIHGQILTHGGRQSWYTKKHVFETIIDDGTGRIFCVWFNQPYLERYFRPGKYAVLYGKVELYKNRLQMIAPEYEIIEKEKDNNQNLSVGRIVPIYPLTKGVTQRYIRKIIRMCLDRYHEQLQDILPIPLRNKYRLSNIKRSLENIHFPESMEMQMSAHRRICFEEFFLFQISVMKRRMNIVNQAGTTHVVDLELINQFQSVFPFELTGAQKRVIREISADLQKPAPMLRLLQGDVGSGKTLIALFGCVVAWRNGNQSVIMAPTEILARQHYQNIQKVLQPGPFHDMKIALLISGLKKKEREEIYRQVRNHEIDLVIGTHALLSEAVQFPNLSFVVIDEQHKFGVQQRALLSAKGKNPDVLVMTATPIPRTLTLTLFGDLDVSTIEEIPKGRGKVSSVLYSSEQIQDVYRIIRDKINKGEQAYIIYPIVEESEKMDLKAAEAMYRYFSNHEFKDLRVGLIHGQMKRQQTEKMMEEFKQGRLHILVATTVLEVGIDVPNANVMVIEHAQRFGLAQLHQLRGRIGRGQKDGLCILVADPITEESHSRLRAILSSTDGFKIAEQDLQIRGPGEYFGRHQHGLNELKYVNPVTQIDILELARKEAREIMHEDPELKEGSHVVLQKTIQKRYPGYLSMLSSG